MITSITTTGIDNALKDTLTRLKQEGVWRNTRGMNCLEFPGPVMVELMEPTARNVLNPARKWNYVLPYSESLWIARGWNVLEDGPGWYVKRLWDFSDDGETWRAAYGPRIRGYTNLQDQYYAGEHAVVEGGSARHVDQLKYVIDTLKKDIQSRQAVITISDPMKDDFNPDGTLLHTKDVPCTRSLHFMADVDGRLNLYVHLRSNDVVFGMSAVNIPNFTLMQEYVSALVGVPMGRYYHIVDNMHVYDFQLDMVEAILNEDEGEDFPYQYQTELRSLEEFDENLLALRTDEARMQQGDYSPLKTSPSDELFTDWQRVLGLKIMEKRKEVDFNKIRGFFHPELQYIFNRKKESKNANK